MRHYNSTYFVEDDKTVVKLVSGTNVYPVALQFGGGGNGITIHFASHRLYGNFVDKLLLSVMKGEGHDNKPA